MIRGITIALGLSLAGCATGGRDLADDAALTTRPASEVASCYANVLGGSATVQTSATGYVVTSSLAKDPPRYVVTQLTRKQSTVYATQVRMTSEYPHDVEQMQLNKACLRDPAAPANAR